MLDRRCPAAGWFGLGKIHGGKEGPTTENTESRKRIIHTFIRDVRTLWSPDISFRVFPCVPWFNFQGSRTPWPNASSHRPGAKDVQNETVMPAPGSCGGVRRFHLDLVTETWVGGPKQFITL